MTFARGEHLILGKEEDDESVVLTEDEDDSEEVDGAQMEKRKKADNRAYKKVKHTFEIQVKELKNIPILDKLIKDV